jgi:hypothetical protein
MRRIQPRAGMNINEDPLWYTGNATLTKGMFLLLILFWKVINANFYGFLFPAKASLFGER